MLDLTLMIVTVAFFSLCVVYTRGLERLGR